ncbi:hypothetical protein BACCOPRO_01342 [Phocaeicola coprophilus DSM 18228 = JCM 13818]|uniref:Uncharacterized protein n=1 Tax=Phocaeicola coprophilus DSM 18228 = JCM 13818 TaxID=547042 RepID=S0F6F9_9BACT|nr:hypothetical protein BACCOPRO_01342 [Phocaeicola coprophilus DSM 18228 = JCM 13818]
MRRKRAVDSVSTTARFRPIFQTPSEGLQKAFGLLKKRFDVSDKTLRRST